MEATTFPKLTRIRNITRLDFRTYPSHEPYGRILSIFFCRWRIRNYQEILIKNSIKKTLELKVSAKSEFIHFSAFYYSLNVCFYCSSRFLHHEIKRARFCRKILFHLRDNSPIFHLYRTFLQHSLNLSAVVFNFDFFLFPLICHFFCLPSWNIMGSLFAARHSPTTCNRVAVGIHRLGIYLQLSFNCMSNMTELLIFRVIKDWFTQNFVRCLSAGGELHVCFCSRVWWKKVRRLLFESRNKLNIRALHLLETFFMRYRTRRNKLKWGWLRYHHHTRQDIIDYSLPFRPSEPQKMPSDIHYETESSKFLATWGEAGVSAKV